MTVIFRLARLAPERLSFGYSPAQEALHSLHVFFDPKEHPLHIPWVLRTRQRMSAALKAELEGYRFLFGRTLPVWWDVRATTDIRSFQEEMAEFRSRPVDPYLTVLVGLAIGRRLCLEEALDPTVQQEALDALAGRHPESVAALVEALSDAQQSRARLAGLLEAWWEQALADDWPRLQELFLTDIERRARLLMRRGVLGALQELTPATRIDPASQTCAICHNLQAEVIISETDRLYLMPTYFAWPHLLISAEKPPYLITYPVFEHQQEGRAPVPPERLLKMLRAAGDMTRMQIMQLIAQQPRSTTELAGMIGISEAAVNKHLKQLQDAGLIAAERRSYYVFYHLVRQSLREIAENIEQTLTGEG